MQAGIHVENQGALRSASPFPFSTAVEESVLSPLT